MTEQQFKRWMIAKTRQYIWLITKQDPNRVRISFMTTFEGWHRDSVGACSKVDKHIYYRTDYIKQGWDCNLEVFENLVIHEVCHLIYTEHDGNFFTLYKHWSGDDFIARWKAEMIDEIRADGRGLVFNVSGLPDLKTLESAAHGG